MVSTDGLLTIVAVPLPASENDEKLDGGKCLQEVEGHFSIISIRPPILAGFAS